MTADQGMAAAAMTPQEPPVLALGLPTRPSALLPPTRSVEPWTEEQWMFRLSILVSSTSSVTGGLLGSAYYKYNRTESSGRGGIGRSCGSGAGVGPGSGSSRESGTPPILECIGAEKSGALSKQAETPWAPVPRQQYSTKTIFLYNNGP